MHRTVATTPRHPHGGQPAIIRRQSSLVAYKMSTTTRRRSLLIRPTTAAASSHNEAETDVVIVGAGVIGLSIARGILKNDEKARVVVLEQQKMLCAGATGAGQGYIWLAHRDPSSRMWQLAQRSKELWHGLADREGPWEAVEWQRTGSLLLASNSEEAGKLEAQAECLKAAGVQAEMISASAVAKLEPSLSIPAEGGGMLVENDAQINGRNSAFLLLNICRVLAQDAGGEFDCKFGEGVTGLEMDGDGGVVGVTTSAGRRITATRAVVIAGGAWSSDFLAQQLKDNRWKGVIAPRMGQLLALTPPTDMPALTRGVMEMSYSKHYQEVGRKSAEGSPADESAPDITFTATTSASGELLLGSSRQFSGFESSAGLETTAAILKRAAEFMPSLSASAAAVSTLLAGGSPEEWSDGLVRTGPRPWAATGLPFVGPILGHPRLYIAAGHEGSGLTLAPVTAEIIEGYISNGGTNVAGAEALAPEFLLK